MSQAFAKMIGGPSVKAFSAGSNPSGRINQKAIVAMKELGYDLKTHRSKSLDQVKEFAPFDVVVTMGCGDACPWMPAKQFIDWQIPDPREMDENDFRKVRDLIKEKVTDLILLLKESNEDIFRGWDSLLFLPARKQKQSTNVFRHSTVEYY